MEAAKSLVAEINQYLTRLNTEQQKAVLTVVKTFAASQGEGKKYDQLKDTINNFSGLQPNWDSYNADAISIVAITIAIYTLDYLHIAGLFSGGFEMAVFPMRDGGIQFEFDGKNGSSELEIDPNGQLTFISFDANGSIFEKKQVLDLTQLSTLLEDTQYA